MAKFKTDWTQYKNVWGIYCIRNTANNKRYIGSAVNLQERIQQHRYELLKGIHFNNHLQRSWEKHGEDVFEIEILETIENIEYETLLKIEENYIIQYNTIDENFGYNKRLNSEFPLLSEESIKIRSEKHELTKIKILAFHADTGKFYKEFESITACAEELGDQTTNVSSARDKITCSVKGFVLVSKDKFDSAKCYKKQKADMSWSKEKLEHMQKNSKYNKQVYSYTLAGELYKEYVSFSQACRELGLHRDTLSHVVRRKKHVLYNNHVYSCSKLSKEDVISLLPNIWKYIPGSHINQFSNK